MPHADWPRAFDLAEQARSAADAIIDQVASGELHLDAAHARGDAEPLVGRTFAVKVYESVPGIGKVKARRSMAAIGLDGGITLAAVPQTARDQIKTRFAELLAEG